MDAHLLVELMMFDANTLGPNVPSTMLGITSNHPIIYAGARRPAKCFDHIKGVKTLKMRGVECLYDIQYDHDGTYIANGVEVQSCSPRSAAKPLPKELYFDPITYSEEVVWDGYDQPMRLISEKVTPRIMCLGNHKRNNYQQRHAQYRKKSLESDHVSTIT
jgi:hypothetical protein